MEARRHSEPLGHGIERYPRAETKVEPNSDQGGPARARPGRPLGDFDFWARLVRGWYDRWVSDEGLKSVFRDPRKAARQRLRDLVESERLRARIHLDLIRRSEPTASPDRLASVILERWTTVAKVEGGMTGMLGFAGVPLNLLLFAYCQLAVTVSIAEAYGIELRGEAGEEALVDVIGRVHGVEDLVRSGPRVLGALARALAVRYGLGTMSRLVPLIAAPVSARLNEREMKRVGAAAMRRFGNVIMLS